MAAAELKLQVGLDLAFFRQQLALLGTTATGYSLPINIDRLAIQKEITKLGRNISNRSYTLKVKTTAAIAEVEVDKLKTALDNLQGKEVGIKITGTLGKIAPKDATKIRNDLAEAVAGGTGKKILVDVGVRENAIGEELRAVRKALNEKITPKNGKILVATSIRSGITNEEAKEFRKSVKRKIGNIIVDVAGSADQLRAKEAKGIRASLYQSIISNGGKIKIPATLTIADSEVAAFQKAVNSKFAGITVKVKAEIEEIRGGKAQAQIEKEALAGWQRIQEMGAARMSGGVSDPARRESLRQSLSGRDIGELRSIGEQLGVKGARRYSNVQNLIEKIVADASIEMIKKYLDPQAVMRNPDRSGLGKVLDTFARGIFHMLGMDPAAMMAAQKQKLLPPAINWQSSVATQPQYQSKPGTMLTGTPSPTLIGGTPGSFGLLPAAYRGIGPGRNAGALPPAYRGIGPSAKPAGLLPSLSSAGQSNAIIEALIASTGPRLLPSGGGDDSLGKLAAPRQTKDAVDAILRNYFKVVEVQVKEVFSAPPVKKESLNIFDHLDMEQYFNYLAQARINTENAIKRSIEEAKQVTKQNRIKDAAESFVRALEDVVRNAERSAFAQSRIAATRSYIQRANIREIGQPLLGGRQVAPPKMLSAATGFYRGAATPPPLPETQAQLFARREREARVRSALRSVDVMGGGVGRTAASYSYAYRAARPTSAIIPYGPGGALATTNQPPTPPTPPGGGRGGFGSFGGFGGAMPNISLPGADLVKEVGNQFGYAAQQVLLFGTTYKALAFLTDFPSKVGEAVAQLQTFRNTLQAITPNADEFQKSNQFILDTVAKYNTPLQSARDGFTNLYASMAPAGFKGDEIRNIFSGISQGAATFGMSADKVDRVNYAFAQMASKGQVMSEELKGQLGDVLPGAVAIFAKAAGFTGTNAMVDFTKAMEAGRYKGEAMKQLLINVGIVMKDKFAKGAEGAAQNFQGQMNAMANATKKLYEAFEPVGNLFASKIIAPFTKGLTVITDGFKAYFDGQRAVNPEAEKLNKILETLVPSLQGIAQNVLFAVKQLAPFAQVVGFVVLQISRLLALPFVRYLAATYLQVLLLTTAFNALATAGVTAAIASLAQFTKGMILHAGVTLGLTKVTQQSTFAMYQFGTAVQTVMIKSVIGIALVAIGALIARIVDLKGQLASIGNDAKGMEELARSSAKIGDVQGTKEAFGNIENRLQTIKKLKGELSKAERMESGMASSSLNAVARKIFKLPIKDDTAKKLIELGYVSEKFLTKTADGYTILEHNLEEVNAKIAAGEKAFSNATQKKNILIDQSIRKNKELKKSVLGAIPDPADDAKKVNLESYYRLEDDLAKAVTEGEIDKANMLFEHRKNLMETYYDIQEARANSFQKATIRFQREIANIEMERQRNVLNAQNNVRKAEGSVAGGAPGGTGAVFGDTGRTFNAKGFVHGHFQNQNREALVQDTVETVIGLLDKGVSPELGSGARFTSGMNAKQVESLVRQGIGSHKQYASGASAVDIFVPKGTQVPVPVSGIQNSGGAGGVAGSLRRGSQLMHLDRASTTQGVGAARKVTGNEGRDINAAQKTQIELDKENLALRQANVLALEKQRVATENYVASIMPVAELELQNQLQDKRNQLQLAGVSDAVLEYEMAKTKATLEQVSVEQALQTLKEKKAKMPLTDVERVQLEQLQKSLDELKAKHPAFYAGLAGKQAGQIQSAYSSNMGSLKNQLQLAGIVDPYAEQRQKYMQGGQSAAQADEQVGIQKQIDTVTRLRDAYRGVADTIGSSFGDAFKGIITGSMTAQEALASFFQNIGNYFVDMVAKMIAEWAKTQVIQGFQSLLGGLGGMFGGGGGGLGSVASNMDKYAPLSEFATGGIATGGFRAFASGGIVTGPTLGLIGEGRYNEAVIPLPDGKSVPVDLGGLSGGMSSGPITVNVSVDAKGTEVQGDNGQGAALGRAIAASVQAELIKQKRPGGLLAR